MSVITMPAEPAMYAIVRVSIRLDGGLPQAEIVGRAGTMSAARQASELSGIGPLRPGEAGAYYTPVELIAEVSDTDPWEFVSRYADPESELLGRFRCLPAEEQETWKAESIERCGPDHGTDADGANAYLAYHPDVEWPILHSAMSAAGFLVAAMRYSDGSTAEWITRPDPRIVD